jgi:hypothetical protein
MKKLITIICILFSLQSSAQVYQLMPQYGYQAPRMAFDSTLQIPTFCGVPTLKSVQFVTKKAAIAFDSCNNRFYQYNPKTLAWSVVSGSGGSIDTTSLSNRINLKIDSIKRRRDSVFAYRNGTEVFQFKDSVGGGGSTPTLNQVLAAGNTATDKNISLVDNDYGNAITLDVNSINATLSINSSTNITSNGIYIQPDVNNFPVIDAVTIDNSSNQIQQKLVMATSQGSVFMPYNNRSSDTLATLFNLRSSGTTIDTANQFVNSVTKVNDSTIRVIKGTSTSDITITTSSVVTAATRLVTSVYNNSGATITKGSVVYISGRHSSNLPTISKAQANNEENSYKTFALVSDNIADNASGLVIQAGNIAGLNLPTSSFTDGDIVYLSPTTAGGLTITKPLAPNHICKIGSVTRTHPTLGSIEIKIENGWQLDELSDVSIPLVPADSVVLQFSRVDSLWHDVTITNAIGSRYIKPSDTSVFQRKQIAANSIMANNTASTSNANATTFKQFGNATYNDSITITGASNPSGAINHSFRWSQIGNLVTLHITLSYATNGSLSQVAMELPDGLPLPILPTGLTSNNDIICYGTGFMVSTTTGVAAVFSKVFLRQNTGLTNDYEIVINQATNSSYRIVNVTIQYFAQ